MNGQMKQATRKTVDGAQKNPEREQDLWKSATQHEGVPFHQ